MEIHALRATLSERDLNDLAAKHLLKHVAIEQLCIEVTPEGVRVRGAYPVLVTVSFETLWELDVEAGKVVARLTRLSALGMPMTVLKTYLLGALSGSERNGAWLQVQGDTLRIDVDRLLAGEGLEARTNLTGIRCEAGLLVIEAAMT
jgi:hypothetical protein